jgi:hypothetical protein
MEIKDWIPAEEEIQLILGREGQVLGKGTILKLDQYQNERLKNKVRNLTIVPN